MSRSFPDGRRRMRSAFHAKGIAFTFTWSLGKEWVIVVKRGLWEKAIGYEALEKGWNKTWMDSKLRKELFMADK